MNALVYLIILFTVVPIVELTLLIKVGEHIGTFYTILIVVFTGIGGAYLTKLEGLATLFKIKNAVNRGNMPIDSLLDGFMILCSGLLLLTPGFITDILGFSGLIPAFRGIIKRKIKQKLGSMVSRGQTMNFSFIDIKK